MSGNLELDSYNCGLTLHRDCGIQALDFLNPLISKHSGMTSLDRPIKKRFSEDLDCLGKLKLLKEEIVLSKISKICLYL